MSPNEEQSHLTPEEIESIDNLIVKRALMQRHARFMFNYGEADHTETQDHKDFHKKGYPDGPTKGPSHHDHRQYGTHGDYDESSGHHDTGGW